MFELGHFAFVPVVLKNLSKIQQGKRKVASEVLEGLRGLDSVQRWRLWFSNLPVWLCCGVAVLRMIGST